MTAAPPAQQLARLVSEGLTFAQTTKVFAVSQEDTQAVIERAREIHGRDGEIEIDEDAVLSPSEDGGAYVMAGRAHSGGSGCRDRPRSCRNHITSSKPSRGPR